MVEQAEKATPEVATVTSQEPAKVEAKTLSAEELVEKYKREKAEANAEAAAFRKRVKELEPMEAELKRIRESEMSDLERAKAKTAELEAAVERERAERARIENESAVKDGGVDPKYASFVAAQFSVAKTQEGFEPKTWLEGFKKDNPAFFGGTRAPAVASGEGGPSRTGRGDDVARYQARFKELSALPQRNSAQQSELFNLSLALRNAGRS